MSSGQIQSEPTQQNKNSRPANELLIIFKQNVRKVIAVSYFFSSLQSYSQMQLKARMQKFLYRRRSLIPFYPDDPFIVNWRKFINAALLITAIYYPFFISFIEVLENYSVFWLTIIQIFNLIYFFDIILSFMIAYVDGNSNLHIKIYQIVLNYITNWFIFDFLSVIPFEFIHFNLQGNFWFRYLKCFRVLKFFFTHRDRDYKGQMAKVSNQPETFINTTSYFWSLELKVRHMISVVFMVFLLNHIFACLWHVVDENIEQKLLFEEYLFSFYWAWQTITVVGYGDIPASRFIEYLSTVGWLLIGVGYYSFTIGNIAYLMIQYDDQAELRHSLHLMDSLSIPDVIKKEVDFFVELNLSKNAFFNISNRTMHKNLPFQLKRYFILSSKLEEFLQISFLHFDVNVAEQLIPQMNYYFARVGSIIYRSGQPSNEVYYLLRGEVRIMTEKKRTLLNILEGTIFGEYESLKAINRTTFAFAVQNSLILFCSAKLFLKKFKENETLWFELQQLFLRREQLINNELLLQIQQSKKLKRMQRMIFNKSLTEQKDQNEVLKTMQKYNEELLISLIGTQQKKKQLLIQKFKLSANKIISLRKLFNSTPKHELQELHDYQLMKILFKDLNEAKDEIVVLFLFFLLFQSKRLSQQQNHQLFNQMMHNYNETKKAENKLLLFLVNNKKESKDRFEKWTLKNMVKKYSNQPLSKNQGKISMLLSKYRKKILKEMQEQKQNKKTQQEQQRKWSQQKGMKINNWMFELFKNLNSIHKFSTQASMLKFQLFEQERLLEFDVNSIQNLLLQKKFQEILKRN